MMRTFLLACLAALAMPAAALAQTAPEAPAQQSKSPAHQRAEQLPALLTGGIEYETYFAPAFQQVVTKPQFDQLTSGLIASYGAPESVLSIEPRSDNTVVAVVRFAQANATMIVQADAEPPHAVTGLRITGITPHVATAEAALDAIEALPGATGYLFARLTDNGPEILRANNADKAFGVGSSFKLLILAELVRATNAGERSWDDIVTLDGRELPGGQWAQSPAGTEVSLRDLAGRMISVSDNSATDILLHHLGREKVEAMMDVVGWTHAEQNRPLLATLELFKLKGIDSGALGDAWIAADEAGRRALLAGPVADAPISAIAEDLFADGKPLRIADIEYFASAADLVRTMNWLRTHSRDNETAREILSANPGIFPSATSHWAFTGYKGGSEPGVINMTLLLQAEDGSWYAFSASWNNVDAAVDNMTFAGLVSRFVELAADTEF
ncbi:serine hydrolase [Stakelama tenebrarum]|uniref:Serine hydrolase n=1 Tax=Stakelama tenebrarum TaxID=2711215 RepID=A0A6G6Y2F2_9SPHN|nr:serine hydrolase [Sphingosinithalassobacter tenebrarum]QIG79102.1 serine hydrolase [Sphingosinithalassobacter tenebrarum]